MSYIDGAQLDVIADLSLELFPRGKTPIDWDRLVSDAASKLGTTITHERTHGQFRAVQKHVRKARRDRTCPTDRQPPEKRAARGHAEVAG